MKNKSFIANTQVCNAENQSRIATNNLDLFELQFIQNSSFAKLRILFRFCFLKLKNSFLDINHNHIRIVYSIISNRLSLFLFMLLFTSIEFYVKAQAGVNDLTFIQTKHGTGNGANDDIRATSIQSDGKIIIAGDFTSYNGVAINRIARINPDGMNDESFNPGVGANNLVNEISIQPDGKIIIVGYFTSYNGVAINHIARLNTDGSLDETFNTGAGANDDILTTSIQSDGKIIIGGWFNTYNGIPRNRIARLNTDGTLDNAFNIGTGANGCIITTAIQNDGKIIIGGWLTSYNGAPRKNIARLNADGTLDGDFNSGNGANDEIGTITIQSDGKIIIGGSFTSYNNTVRNCIARINSDGSLDNTFNPGTGAYRDISGGVDLSIVTTNIQKDGKIIIGGSFTSFNGIPNNNITRLNADGRIDKTFNSGTGASNPIFTTSIQSDGKIIIGGWLTSYNGTPRKNIVRINNDGTIDKGFNLIVGADSFVEIAATQSDGKIIIGGGFTSYYETTCNHIGRLNVDGTFDETFNPDGIGANSSIQTISLQSDKKIIIGGDFTLYNGTPRNHIARLYPNGTLDQSFNPGTGANDHILTTTIQSDGKIIIGGYSFNGFISNLYIARLNVDGSLDDTFTSELGQFGSSIESTAIQKDGKIIIVGSFTSINGVSSRCIARLNADGTLDGNFNSGFGANDKITTITMQSDGKIIIGGFFNSYNGTSQNHIARINTDGSLDNTFNIGTGVDGEVEAIVFQPDGKIIIGGFFNSYNGIPRKNIARINVDGTLDYSFDPGVGTNGYVITIALQRDGKIIVGGNFASNNGVFITNLCRLLNNTVSSVNTVQEKEILVYPNPVLNEFIIDTDWNKGVSYIEITNIKGQIVLRRDFIKETTIYTKHLEAGVYIIKLYDGESFVFKKIIKE